MPRFSVVIACYNAEDTLPETLHSLQQQSTQSWEAVCVDDGSTDGTLALLQDAAANDSRIRVVTGPNAGPSWARNTGVALAQSEWIAFLDADDIWLPEKLAEVGAITAMRPDVDAVYGQIAFYDPKTQTNTTLSTVSEGISSLEQLLGENPVCTLSNLSIRRETFLEIGGFKDDMRYSEDLELLIRLAAAGHTLMGTPSLHVLYRASDAGLSANLLQMHEGWREAIRSAGTELSPPSRARAEAVHLRYLARRALRLNTSSRMALTLALRGVRLAPLAFLGGRHRGPLTFLSCLLTPLLPLALRRRLFA